MAKRPSKRIMMISTHGYVGANPELGKPDTGGQVVFVLKLSECLGRLGYEVDICTRQFEDQPAEEKVTENVRVLRFPCGGSEFIGKETLCQSIPEWTENALAFIRSEGLQYLFINSHYWDAGIAGDALAGELGVPHLHTPHSLGAWKRRNMDGDPQDLERKYNFVERIAQEQRIYSRCGLLLATSEEQLHHIKTDYEVPDGKVVVIPPGYDDRQFFPVSSATRQGLKQDLDAEGPIVLALGRMAHNKGYDLLIRSMSVVVKRIPEARLLLAVGSSAPSAREIEQIEELRQLADELGLKDHVLFRDYIPDEQLADYYRVADVFALSSRYEPFGMTAVEAMACGTPAVVTTEGGLWKMLDWGQAALYANPFDTEAYGHALTTILQHPEVADRLSETGALAARARFTWTGIAQEVLRVMQPLEEEMAQRTGKGPVAPTDASLDPRPGKMKPAAPRGDSQPEMSVPIPSLDEPEASEECLSSAS